MKYQRRRRTPLTVNCVTVNVSKKKRVENWPRKKKKEKKKKRPGFSRHPGGEKAEKSFLRVLHDGERSLNNNFDSPQTLNRQIGTSLSLSLSKILTSHSCPICTTRTNFFSFRHCHPRGSGGNFVLFTVLFDERCDNASPVFSYFLMYLPPRIEVRNISVERKVKMNHPFICCYFIPPQEHHFTVTVRQFLCLRQQLP